MRAPVGVIVLTTMPSSGQRRRISSTSGTAAADSPTETAWIQQRGSGGSPSPSRPNRWARSRP